MMNFLALASSSYESTARGILYVIYEMLWKIIYYALILIDEIAKLFYKIAGINFDDGVIENKNMFQQLLNQNVISSWYGIFTIIAIGLVLVCSLVAIIKAMAASDGGKKSLGPIIKNIGLASLLLITLGPIILFFISLVSNIGISIASIGGNTNISISDILFSNSGNLLTVYNETFSSEYTSFRNLGNDFLYSLVYEPKEGVTKLDFHWYIVLIGSFYVLYNLASIVIEMVKRIFNIIILYVGSPIVISKMALDDGKSFKTWQSKFLYEFLLFFAQIATFMVFVALVNILNNIDFEALTTSTGTSDPNDSILEPLPGEETTTEVTTGEYSLLNGVGRTLIIMTAVNVTRTSATLFANLLSGKEDKTEGLLETLVNKVSTSRASSSPTLKTRTITRNTTKRETVYVEASTTNNRFADNPRSNNNNIDNPRSTNNTVNLTQHINVNNKYSANNNFASRPVRENIRSGSYNQSSYSPGNIYINASRIEQPTTTKQTSWNFIEKEMKTKENTTIVNNFTKANTNLTNAINNKDNANLTKTLNEYTKAYSKEADILNKNYKQFESRANASLKSGLEAQAREELKKISTAYTKAQADYNRTATKLNQYSNERISTADALKIKEKADKQRETLMSASNRAAQFYENQKKGEE